MQDSFAPGTLFVPRHSSASHMELANAHTEHLNMHADQQLHGPTPSHYVQTDSALFQHYADMGHAQDPMTHMLTADAHMTPPASFALEPNMHGECSNEAIQQHHISLQHLM